MTSQVAVMNLKGVAIASDTVVTDVGGGEPKVLGNVSKIYEPGSDHKFVVLHSSYVNINGVPHQIHLSGWFETLGKPLPTLAAYIDSYRAWIATERRMITQAGEENTINRMLNQVYYELKRELDDSLSWYAPPEGTDRKKKQALESFLADIVNRFFSGLNALDPYPGLTDRQAAVILKNTGLDIEDKVRFIFGDFPLDAETMSNLAEWAHLIINRERGFSEVDSELAFVGFGSEDPFPAVIRLHCRGVYGGALRAGEQPGQILEPIINDSSIHYFAQYDSMYGFVNGFSNSIRRKYHEVITEKVEERWGADTPEPIGDRIATEIVDVVDSFADATFVQPLLRTVSSMGLASLADFAESLVGLQATSTYSKPGAATVGGLIEVATIDKVNGVVWHRGLPSTAFRID
jgi:hypothetical protein